MKNKSDIVICGVGGQGILLCSNIIGNAAIKEGIEVRGFEVHGMAQRSGSVEAHIRLNCKYGPKIPIGKGDILIGFEPLEAARYSYYLKKEGVAIVNSYKIPILGNDYDIDQMFKIIKRKTENIYIENFTEKAKEIGSVKVLNILMLGYASKFIPIKRETFKKAIKEIVKPEFVDINVFAFECGIKMLEKNLK